MTKQVNDPRGMASPGHSSGAIAALGNAFDTMCGNAQFALLVDVVRIAKRAQGFHGTLEDARNLLLASQEFQLVSADDPARCRVRRRGD